MNSVHLLTCSKVAWRFGTVFDVKITLWTIQQRVSSNRIIFAMILLFLFDDTWFSCAHIDRMLITRQQPVLYYMYIEVQWKLFEKVSSFLQMVVLCKTWLQIPKNTNDKWNENVTSNEIFRYIRVKLQERYRCILTIENFKSDAVTC